MTERRPVDWMKTGRLYQGPAEHADAATDIEISPAFPRCDAAPPESHRDKLAILSALYDKLRAGLERIIDGTAEDHDARLLSKTGGAIDAFNALAGAQGKLIQLERLAFDRAAELGGGDPVQELAAKLRAAQREMDAVTGGTPPDTPAPFPFQP